MRQRGASTIKLLRRVGLHRHAAYRRRAERTDLLWSQQDDLLVVAIVFRPDSQPQEHLVDVHPSRQGRPQTP